MFCFGRTLFLAVLLIWGAFAAVAYVVQAGLKFMIWLAALTFMILLSPSWFWTIIIVNNSPELKEGMEALFCFFSAIQSQVRNQKTKGTLWCCGSPEIPINESSCTDRNQTTQNSSSPMTQVNTTMSVQMGKKALLCCPSSLLTKALLITWEITPRGRPSCIIAYRVETRETNETNCLGKSITWVFTPDLSPYLQISSVALQHEGQYSCEIVAPEGNFQKVYDLQVLVPPEVTYFPGENRTAVCEAIAGKPAAQISWTPDGDCVTKNELHSNGTVTVRSTCHWKQNNVSAVSCWVYHSTGNQTVVIELSRGGDQLLGSYILYIIPSIIILIIIGCICLLKISGFRKCKLPKSEATPAVEEDEMQPYASYTEKSNPLYDTVTKVEACPVSQGEVNGTDWLTLSATGI